MTQPISKETLKTALLELARTDRELFLELWADILKDVAPASSKPKPSKKAAKKVTFTVLKTKGRLKSYLTLNCRKAIGGSYVSRF